NLTMVPPKVLIDSVYGALRSGEIRNGALLVTTLASGSDCSDRSIVKAALKSNCAERAWCAAFSTGTGSLKITMTPSGNFNRSRSPRAPNQAQLVCDGLALHLGKRVLRRA